jgi:hypothetical protein
MEIDITNFFGLDLTKEPDDSWTLIKEGYKRRPKRKDSSISFCSYKEDLNTYGLMLSESARDDLGSLFQDSKIEEMNNHKYLVIEKSGYKFMTNEALLKYLMVLIKKQ